MVVPGIFSPLRPRLVTHMVSDWLQDDRSNFAQVFLKAEHLGSNRFSAISQGPDLPLTGQVEASTHFGGNLPNLEL